MNRGNVKLLFGLTGLTLLCFLALPAPSEMAAYWIGCTSGNYQPSNTCLRVCRMLGNLTGCCYGVNYSGRSACSCCAETPNCPINCLDNCVMVSINAETCLGTNEQPALPGRENGGGISAMMAMLQEDYDGLVLSPELIPIRPDAQILSLVKEAK